MSKKKASMYKNTGFLDDQNYVSTSSEFNVLQHTAAVVKPANTMQNISGV